MRMTRLALAAYPPAFKERYAGELAALVDDLDDLGAGPRTAFDLLRGATLAWMRPPLPAHPEERVRRRMQATVTTVWVAWCLGCLAGPATNRWLLDPPTPAAGATVRDLLNVAQVAWYAGAVLAVLGTLAFVRPVLLPALRRRDWPALRPILTLLAVAVAECGLTLALVLRVHQLPQGSRPSEAVWALLAAWLAGFAALVLVAAAAPAVTMVRTRPAARTLRGPAALAVVVTLALAVVVVASLAASAMAGAGWFSLPPLVVGAVATAAALTSTARGLRSGAVRSG